MTQLSEYTNIKATTPEDILVTEVFLTGKNNVMKLKI